MGFQRIHEFFIREDISLEIEPTILTEVRNLNFDHRSGSPL